MYTIRGITYTDRGAFAGEEIANSFSYEERLAHAILIYEKRRIHRDPKERKRNPAGMIRGVFSGPRGAGVWIPMPVEVRECCKRIAPPTSKYPYVYLKHCVSAGHVANLFNVSKKDILRALNKRTVLKCPECGRFLRKDQYVCERCASAAS